MGLLAATQHPAIGDDASVEIEEHWIDVEGLRQRLWLIVPRGSTPLPAVVWNHGSRIGLDANGVFKDRSHEPQVHGNAREWRAWARESRIAIVVPEGRGYGGSEGQALATVMNDPEALMRFLDGRARDAVAATRWAMAHPRIHADAMVSSGTSHGGVVALLASAQCGYAGTAILATGPWYGRADVGLDAMRDAAARGQGPLLVQRMLTDTLVPASYSREIHAAALAAHRPSTLREYTGVAGVEGHAMLRRANWQQWSTDYDRFLDVCFARG